MKIMLSSSQVDELIHYINATNDVDSPDFMGNKIIELEDSIKVPFLVEFRVIDSGRKRIGIIKLIRESGSKIQTASKTES
jgi:hypothetical protein